MVLCPLSLPILDLRTHCGALLFSELVTAYLIQEISLCRVAGPFDAVPFTDSFVASPLNTVPKRDSAERRVTVDLSSPFGTSVNDRLRTIQGQRGQQCCVGLALPS